MQMLKSEAIIWEFLLHCVFLDFYIGPIPKAYFFIASNVKETISIDEILIFIVVLTSFMFCFWLL